MQHCCFVKYTYRTSVENSFAADALRGNWEVTPLASAFFTQTNVLTIQNQIRKAVYDKSGPKKYVIDDQSVDELTIIMRTMYLQYAQNLPYGVTNQIEKLKTQVQDLENKLKETSELAVKEREVEIKEQTADLKLKNGVLESENTILKEGFKNMGFDVKDMKNILDKLVEGVISKNEINVIK